MINWNILINYTSWVYDVTNRYMPALRGHKYHILPTSSSPILISFALLMLLMTFVFNFHGSRAEFFFFENNINNIVAWFHSKIFSNAIEIYYFGILNSIFTKLFVNFVIYKKAHIFWLSPFLLTLGIFFLWSSNAIGEGTTVKAAFFNFKKNSFSFAGKLNIESLFHSNLVWKGFKIGFILFIISEIMFFFGFFWGFFHSSISPTVQIGAVWPPIDVEFITVKGFAIANTVILLTSGATLTIAHYAFELIPQKRNNLYKNNVSFVEAEEIFEERLNKNYNELNKKIFNSSKPEIYLFPFSSYFKILDSKFPTKSQYSFAIPFNLLFNPFKKHFAWNLGLKDTEILVKLYINLMLDATILLALLFMIFQVTEYFISPVNINTGIYGSTFYMITGLHGAHVFIGTCFLIYCRSAVSIAWNIKSIFLFFYACFKNLFFFIYRDKKIIFSETKESFKYIENSNPVDHYGKFGIESFESAAWYWHFVDVVWIFVFGFVYVWSHLTVLDQQ